jgi:hypothetical protein
MQRLLKSKLFWLAAVYVCIFVVALVFAINAEPETAPCECTLEDIRGNEKFGGDVYFDAAEKNISNQMTLFLYFDHELSDDEILQVEQIGLEINNDSWLPTQAGGSYSAECIVENICRLACLDIVKRVTSGEGTIELY